MMIKKILFTCALLINSLSSLAVERNPSAYEFNKEGLRCLEKGDTESASEFFIKAVIAEPSNKYYCNNMAASLMRRGDYSGAEKFLFHAISLDSSYTRALSNMSITLFHLGRYSESYTYYIRSLKTDRGYTKTRFEKGKVRAAIRKIADRKPDDGKLKSIVDYLENNPGK